MNNYSDYSDFVHTYKTLTHDDLIEILGGHEFITRCIDFKDVNLETIDGAKFIRYTLNKNKKYFENENETYFPISSYHNSNSGRGGTGTGIVGFYKGVISSFHNGKTMYTPRLYWCQLGYKSPLKDIEERIHISPHLPFRIISREEHIANRTIKYAKIRLLILSGDSRGKISVNFLDQEAINGNSFDLQIIITNGLNERLGIRTNSHDINHNIMSTNPISDKEIMIVSREKSDILCDFLWKNQKEIVLKYFENRFKVLNPVTNKKIPRSIKRRNQQKNPEQERQNQREKKIKERIKNQKTKRQNMFARRRGIKVNPDNQSVTMGGKINKKRKTKKKNKRKK